METYHSLNDPKTESDCEVCKEKLTKLLQIHNSCHSQKDCFNCNQCLPIHDRLIKGHFNNHIKNNTNVKSEASEADNILQCGVCNYETQQMFYEHKREYQLGKRPTNEKSLNCTL